MMAVILNLVNKNKEWLLSGVLSGTLFAIVRAITAAIILKYRRKREEQRKPIIETRSDYISSSYIPNQDTITPGLFRTLFRYMSQKFRLLRTSLLPHKFSTLIKLLTTLLKKLW